MKLPSLASHYFDHKYEDKSTSLLSFLFKHYCIEDGSDKDANEDNKLPFKSSENLSTISSIWLVPPQFTTTIPKPQEVIISIYFLKNDEFIPLQYLATIWQPPRCC